MSEHSDNSTINNHNNDSHDNHNSHGGHGNHIQMYKTRFFASLFLAIPIILLSPMMGMKLPFQFAFEGSSLIVLVLSTILFFYGGSPFLVGAREELGEKNPAMMTLISLGITVSYIYSVYAYIANNILHTNTHIMDFFWELASLIVIMLLGHWIEMRAVHSAGDALKSMAELLPSTATLIDDEDNQHEISLKDVVLDSKLLVRAGEKVPTDGIVISGSTTVNESMITGEAIGVKKNIDDRVIGGSLNESGVITIRVTGTGKSGYLSQVMELVSTAQEEKSRAEALSDQVAKALFYVALGVGILAFIAWFFYSRDINIALERLVTVLIIACPHALGLAIPLVTARSTSIGARNGLLIKDRKALEAAHHVDIIMMDKTGTLTEGNFAVNLFKSFSNEYTDDEVLALMGSLEMGSNHPLAVGILDKVKDLNLNMPKLENILNIPGIGLEGQLNGRVLKITSVSYLQNNKIDYDENLFLDTSSKGNSISFLLVDDENIGIVAQGDEIKPESKRMIDELKRRNIKPAMLTGDNPESAKAVARQLDIDIVHAQLMPEDKGTLVKEYIDKGDIVMMVGDGVNDAPSLAMADIGIAIGAGTDVAIDSADVILVKSNPSDIIHFLSLAENTTKKMKQNLWWGAGYNIIAIPLAAGVLSFIGIVLTPAVGAVLMSASTVIVAINAMTLKIDTE